MITVRRSVSRDGPSDVAGSRVTLTSVTWTVAFGGSRGGIGWTYRHPVLIEVDGPDPLRRAIHDHVMLVRSVSAALLVLLTLRRRSR